MHSYIVSNRAFSKLDSKFRLVGAGTLKPEDIEFKSWTIVVMFYEGILFLHCVRIFPISLLPPLISQCLYL